MFSSFGHVTAFIKHCRSGSGQVGLRTPCVMMKANDKPVFYIKGVTSFIGCCIDWRWRFPNWFQRGHPLTLWCLPLHMSSASTFRLRFLDKNSRFNEYLLWSLATFSKSDFGKVYIVGSLRCRVHIDYGFTAVHQVRFDVNWYTLIAYNAYAD